MMKQAKPIVAVAILVLAIAVAGCASSQNASPQPSASATATSLSMAGNEISTLLPLDSRSSVSAVLNTSGGNRLDKTIEWFVNDQPVGKSTTDQFGVARLSLKSARFSLALGRNYTIRAVFNGDSAYLPSNDTSNLTPYMNAVDYYKMVYDQTVGLVQSRNFPSLSNATRFTGTSMAFDLSHNTTTPGNAAWPWAVPAGIYNESSTVFFVKTTKLDLVGRYYSETTNEPGAMGYRAQFDIYVIKYPEKTLIGKYTIISEPPNTRLRYETDQIGNSADWKNWLSQHTGDPTIWGE